MRRDRRAGLRTARLAPVMKDLRWTALARSKKLLPNTMSISVPASGVPRVRCGEGPGIDRGGDIFRHANSAQQARIAPLLYNLRIATHICGGCQVHRTFDLVAGCRQHHVSQEYGNAN
jgi:hypothetical protein